MHIYKPLIVSILYFGLTTVASANSVFPNNQVPSLGMANALVESPKFQLDDEQISDMLILSIQAKYPALAKQPRLSVSLQRDNDDLDSPDALAKADGLTVEDVSYDANRQNYRATLQVWSGAKPIGLLAVSGEVKLQGGGNTAAPKAKSLLQESAYSVQDALVEIPVLTRNIRSGEVIAPQDIAMQPTNTRGYDQFMTNANQLVGQAAKRSLIANRPIRTSDVGQPVLLNRGQLVTILYQSENMALTATGKVQENAGLDQLVNVMNLQSNRTIQAVVSGPNLVTVGGGIGGGGGATTALPTTKTSFNLSH
jgi:flagella basal body P-ring formation protein FlgA